MPQAPARRATSKSSDVARLVRLHHRRRGWAFVAAGSVAGLVVYAGIDVKLVRSLTGAAATLSIITVLVLLALALVGLVVVIVDTSLIHRAEATSRADAKGSVSHHPLYAHAYRLPPRHAASWIAVIFMLVAMTGITAYILPAEVNSWAYVLGAEHQDTFNPVSYSHCPVRPAGCQVVTEGYLSGTGAHVNWATQVPLGQPFSVRDPLWAWGTGRGLIDGDGSAIPTIVAGLFFDAVALLLLYVVFVIVRETSPGQSQQKRVLVSAGRDPTAVPRRHHSDHGHHGDAHRRAHRSHHKR